MNTVSLVQHGSSLILLITQGRWNLSTDITPILLMLVTLLCVQGNAYSQSAVPLQLLNNTAVSLNDVTEKDAQLNHTLYFKANPGQPIDSSVVEVRYIGGPDGTLVIPELNGEPASQGGPAIARFTDIQPNSTVQAQLTATLEIPGDYYFSVDVIAGQRSTHKLKVTRLSSDVRIGSNNSGPIQTTIKSASLSHPLTLHAIGDIDAEAIRVKVDVLTGPNQSVVQPQIKDQKNPWEIPRIEGNTSHPFTLTGEFPESGVYSGVITLTYLGGAKLYPIQITKELKPASLDGQHAAPGRAAMSILGPADVELHVSIQETAGHALSLERPDIRALVNQRDTKNPDGPRYDEITYWIGGEEFGTQTRPSIPIEPGDAHDLTVKITNVKDPGHYTGKLVLEATDRSPAEADVSFFVRRAWPIAGFFIILGISLAVAVRFWFDAWRPRMRKAIEVANTAQGLRYLRDQLGVLSDYEEAVFAHLRQVLVDDYDALRSEPNAVATIKVQTVERKLKTLEEWTRLSIFVRETDNTSTEIRADLDTLRRYLMAPKVDDNQHKTAEATLDALRVKIKAEIQQRLEHAIQELDAFEPELAEKTLHDEWQSAVHDQLGLAKAAFEDGEFGKADKHLDTARIAAAALLAEDLSIRPRPKYMLVDAYNRMERLLALAIDPPDIDTGGRHPLERYREALGLYLNGLAVTQINQLEDSISEIDGQIKAGAGDKQELKTLRGELATHRDGLAKVKNLVKHNELTAARNLCNDAANALEKMPKPVHVPTNNRYLFKSVLQFAKTQKPGRQTVSPAPIDFGIEPIEIPLPSLGAEAKTTIKKLEATIKTGDWIYLVLVGFIATILGVFVLWANNPQWGSYNDVLLAFLWGLGLQGLATQPGAYQGLASLTKSIR